MKRPYKPGNRKNTHRTGDIKRDLSEKQLAAIGAVALAYNEVELQIDMLVLAVLDLPEKLQLDVLTRINGIDGKIALINNGAALLPMRPEARRQLEEALGAGVFTKLKDYRNGAVHCRVFDASFGIGLNVERKGRLSEVLLSQPALDRLYEHLIALRDELESASRLINGILSYHKLASGDLRKASLSQAALRWTAQFQEHQSRRKSLKPIPRFPSESELREAETRWLQASQAELTEIVRTFVKIQEAANAQKRS